MDNSNDGIMRPDCLDVESASVPDGHAGGAPLLYACENEDGLALARRILEGYRRPRDRAASRLSRYVLLRDGAGGNVVAYMERGYARALLDQLAETIEKAAETMTSEALKFAEEVFALPEEAEEDDPPGVTGW